MFVTLMALYNAGLDEFILFQLYRELKKTFAQLRRMSVAFGHVSSPLDVHKTYTLYLTRNCDLLRQTCQFYLIVSYLILSYLIALLFKLSTAAFQNSRHRLPFLQCFDTVGWVI